MRHAIVVLVTAAVGACATQPGSYDVPSMAISDNSAEDALAELARTLTLEGFTDLTSDYRAGTLSGTKRYGNSTGELQAFFAVADCGLQSLQMPDGGRVDLRAVATDSEQGSVVRISTTVTLDTTPSAANRYGSVPASFSCSSRGVLEARILDSMD